MEEQKSSEAQGCHRMLDIPRAGFRSKANAPTVQSHCAKTAAFLTSALPDENGFYNGRVAHAETPQRLFGTLPGPVKSNSLQTSLSVRERRRCNFLFWGAVDARISEQFRNNKSPTVGKTMYYAMTESKANQQDSQLPLNSGTRGRRFKSSQARHSFNHLRACLHPQEPHCGDFCGDPK